MNKYAQRNLEVPELTELEKAQFWGKVEIGEQSECWPWKLSLNSHGYGQTRLRGRTMRANRVAASIAFGNRLVGAEVLHRCDNPKCCNPDHLFIGTHQDNMRDKLEKGRQPSGETHWRVRNPELAHAGPRGGTSLDLCRRVRELFSTGFSYSEIHDLTGVPLYTIKRIKLGRKQS